MHCFSVKHKKRTRTARPCFLFGALLLPHVTFVKIVNFFYFFGGLEQSTVQLFRELSNPALDLSRAAWPNRILVLTLMTIPPAVAEPPVGHQEECVGEAGESGREVTDRDRDQQSDSLMPLVPWNNQGSRTEGEHTNSWSALYSDAFLFNLTFQPPPFIKSQLFISSLFFISWLLLLSHHFSASTYPASPAASTVLPFPPVRRLLALWLALYGWIGGKRVGLLCGGGCDVAVRTRTRTSSRRRR